MKVPDDSLELPDQFLCFVVPPKGWDESYSVNMNEHRLKIVLNGGYKGIFFYKIVHVRSEVFSYLHSCNSSVFAQLLFEFGSY